MTLRWAKLILILGLALLSAAWLGGQPPGAGPDESAHLVKAFGAASAQGLGATPDTEPTPGNAFLASFARKFSVPESYTFPVRPPCFVGNSQRSAACLDEGAPPIGSPQDPFDSVLDRSGPGSAVSYVANYPPLPYLLPGAVAWAGNSPTAAFRLARAAQALTGLVLLSLALRGAGRFELAGLALAVSPMVVFLLGTLNPSGVSVAGAMTLTACGARLRRSPTPSQWWSAGAGGTVLALSRPDGPAFAVALVVLLSVLLGPDGRRSAWAASRRAATGAVWLMVTGVVTGTAWVALVMARVPTDQGPAAGTALRKGVDQVPYYLRALVGVFGWIGIRLPTAWAVSWLLAAAALGVLAVLVGTNRQRVVVLVASTLLPVLLVAEHLFFSAIAAGSTQARYLLPLAAAAPILAGAVLEERCRLSTFSRLGLLGLAGLVSGVQLFSFWVVGQVYATGSPGPLNWVQAARWVPEGGWEVWVALAVAGSAAVFLALVLCAVGRVETSAVPRMRVEPVAEHAGDALPGAAVPERR